MLNRVRRRFFSEKNNYPRIIFSSLFISPVFPQHTLEIGGGVLAGGGNRLQFPGVEIDVLNENLKSLPSRTVTRIFLKARDRFAQLSLNSIPFLAEVTLEFGNRFSERIGNGPSGDDRTE